MLEQGRKILHVTIVTILIFQLSGCGTLLYPERRGQVAGRLDVGVVILDTLGLLLFIIPGVIAFAVDFGNGCIYLPAKPVVVTTADLRVIKFDPKHTSLAQLEKIIKDQTGYTVKFAQANVRISRIRSGNEMVEKFARYTSSEQANRFALNNYQWRVDI